MPSTATFCSSVSMLSAVKKSGQEDREYGEQHGEDREYDLLLRHPEASEQSVFRLRLDVHLI